MQVSRTLRTTMATPGRMQSNLSIRGESCHRGVRRIHQIANAVACRILYTPVAVVEPSNAQQVAAAVKCGVDAQYYINPRGGGHSYAAAAFGGTNGHLMIDLKNLNSVNVYGEQAVIGGGGKLGSIALELDQQGRGMAHGVCPFVGIGGHGAYGGFGFFSRNWGLVVDQVTSLEVVTFDGQIRNVSSTGNDTELFYALRGAGGSYGIITAFGVQTHAAPSTLVYGIYKWDDQSVDATAGILSAYQNWSSTSAPKEWGSTLNMNAGSSRGLVNMSFTITYMGDQSTFNNVISSLLAQLPAPTTTPTPTSQGWKDTLQLLAGNQNLNTSLANDYQDTFYAKSIMTPQASPMSMDALTNFATYLSTNGVDAVKNNQQEWFVQVELYGGANSQINAVAVNDTAFVHRSSLFTIQFYASSASCKCPYLPQI